MRWFGKRLSTPRRKVFDPGLRGETWIKMGGPVNFAGPLFFVLRAFSGCGGGAFLLGFLRKTACRMWCFGGQDVVDCMVKMAG
jgi:hypothetical protein